MLSLKVAPKGASFRFKSAKILVFPPENSGFSGFLFTDKYTGPVDQAAYFVALAMIVAAGKAEFSG
jgi:hypothetical protein